VHSSEVPSTVVRSHVLIADGMLRTQGSLSAMHVRLCGCVMQPELPERYLPCMVHGAEYEETIEMCSSGLACIKPCPVYTMMANTLTQGCLYILQCFCRWLVAEQCCHLQQLLQLAAAGIISKRP
jgi:hypothetical protein